MWNWSFFILVYYHGNFHVCSIDHVHVRCDVLINILFIFCATLDDRCAEYSVDTRCPSDLLTHPPVRMINRLPAWPARPTVSLPALACSHSTLASPHCPYPLSACQPIHSSIELIMELLSAYIILCMSMTSHTMQEVTDANAETRKSVFFSWEQVA